MTPEYIEEHQIIERYLAGRLSEEEAAEFEARLLWDEKVQEQFELTWRLREGVLGLAHSAVAASPASERPHPADAAPPALARPPGPSRMAMAASLLIAVGAGFMLSQALRQQSIDSMSSGQVYQLELLRGAPDPNFLPTVRPGDKAAWVTLLAYPSVTDGAPLRPSLSRKEDDDWIDIWRGETVTGKTNGSVAIAVRNNLLRPGIYRLRFESSAGEDASGIVYFRVPEPGG